MPINLPPRRLLTACILALNEHDKITACIESLDFAQEILVLDSESTDGTPELCRRLGCKVEIRPFDDYASQRNAAAKLAAHDWILFVDADERVTPHLQTAIKEALVTDSLKIAAYRIRRKNLYLGRWLRFGAWTPDYVVRFYDRRWGDWIGSPHEKLRLRPGATVQTLPGFLEHRSFRNLADQVDRLNRYSSLAIPQERRFPVLQMLLRPAWKFFRVYLLKLGFLEGRRGLIQATISAFSTFLTWAKQVEKDLAPSSHDA